MNNLIWETQKDINKLNRQLKNIKTMTDNPESILTMDKLEFLSRGHTNGKPINHQAQDVIVVELNKLFTNKFPNLNLTIKLTSPSSYPSPFSIYSDNVEIIRFNIYKKSYGYMIKNDNSLELECDQEVKEKERLIASINSSNKMIEQIELLRDHPIRQIIKVFKSSMKHGLYFALRGLYYDVKALVKLRKARVNKAESRIKKELFRIKLCNISLESLNHDKYMERVKLRDAEIKVVSQVVTLLDKYGYTWQDDTSKLY